MREGTGRLVSCAPTPGAAIDAFRTHAGGRQSHRGAPQRTCSGPGVDWRPWRDSDPFASVSVDRFALLGGRRQLDGRWVVGVSNLINSD